MILRQPFLRGKVLSDITQLKNVPNELVKVEVSSIKCPTKILHDHNVQYFDI